MICARAEIPESGTKTALDLANLMTATTPDTGVILALAHANNSGMKASRSQRSPAMDKALEAAFEAFSASCYTPDYWSSLPESDRVGQIAYDRDKYRVSLPAAITAALDYAMADEAFFLIGVNAFVEAHPDLPDMDEMAAFRAGLNAALAALKGEVK
jgi:hypothetical protein